MGGELSHTDQLTTQTSQGLFGWKVHGFAKCEQYESLKNPFNIVGE